jgi:endonuclease/exonuclease/phosphatase family metal-dependent hydrolase
MKALVLLTFCLVCYSVSAKTISVMSYNVENLFDTIHDPGKEDYTYLPLSLKQSSPEIQAYCNGLARDSWIKSCLETDWNESVLNNKIKNISKVLSTYNKGRGADIIVVEEVENKRVLTQLVDKGLSKLGYKYISLIEGPDSRGIDVGVISKYPIVSEKLHLVDLTGIAKNTRGILEVKIKVGNKSITVFGNHWPSQNNPSTARMEASKILIEKAKESDSNVIIATGDFNTLETEVPNAINNLNDEFIDVHYQAQLRVFKNLWPGTHWYKRHWGSLDKMFVLKRFYGATLKFRSFNILPYKYLLGLKELTDIDTGEVTTFKNIPQRFNIGSGKGYSDHLPIVFAVNL